MPENLFDLVQTESVINLEIREGSNWRSQMLQYEVWAQTHTVSTILLMVLVTLKKGKLTGKILLYVFLFLWGTSVLNSVSVSGWWPYFILNLL